MSFKDSLNRKACLSASEFFSDLRKRKRVGIGIFLFLLTIAPAGAQNQPPSGTSRTVTTLEDTPYVFVPADFGFTDSDAPSNHFAAIKITTLPTAGVLRANSDVVTNAGQTFPLVQPVGTFWGLHGNIQHFEAVASSADGSRLAA